MGSILETVMLVCFGISWPLNVIKAYRARTAKVISGQTNYVLAAYILNLAIVSLNMVIYFRNVALDHKQNHHTHMQEKRA